MLDWRSRCSAWRNGGSVSTGKTEAPSGASVIVLRRDAVLMVERARPPFAGLWSFPGGRAEPGEARRRRRGASFSRRPGLKSTVLSSSAPSSPAPDRSPFSLTVFAARAGGRLAEGRRRCAARRVRSAPRGARTADDRRRGRLDRPRHRRARGASAGMKSRRRDLAGGSSSRIERHEPLRPIALRPRTSCRSVWRGVGAGRRPDGFGEEPTGPRPDRPSRRRRSMKRSCCGSRRSSARFPFCAISAAIPTVPPGASEMSVCSPPKSRRRSAARGSSPASTTATRPSTPSTGPAPRRRGSPIARYLAEGQRWPATSAAATASSPAVNNPFTMSCAGLRLRVSDR